MKKKYIDCPFCKEEFSAKIEKEGNSKLEIKKVVNVWDKIFKD